MQEQFVDAVYDVIRRQAVPLIFDRQIQFVNFTAFGKQSPTYINLIRNPAEKIVSRSVCTLQFKNSFYVGSETKVDMCDII